MTHEPAKYAAAIKAKLGKLADLRARSDAAEANIQEAAGKRLTIVETDLAKLRPRAMLDDEIANKVEELTLERARLERIQST